jgi:hypothetical protein
MDCLQHFCERHNFVVCFVLVVRMSFVFSAVLTLPRMVNDPRADSVVVVHANMIGLPVHFLRCRFPTSWGDKLPSILFCKFSVARLLGLPIGLSCSAFL